MTCWSNHMISSHDIRCGVAERVTQTVSVRGDSDLREGGQMIGLTLGLGTSRRERKNEER